MSNFLDRYGRAQTVCHALPAGVKLLLALAVVLAALAVPPRMWPLSGVLITVCFIGHTLARIPMSYLLRRLTLFLPLVVVMSVSIPATQGFRAGWEIMTAILMRSTASFLAALWLVNVMPFEQLLVTLRKLWVPDVLIAMLAFMYRYFFVLWDELERMRTARRARNFDGGGWWLRWRTSAQLVGMLLIRAMGRAERVHGAMCARGWDGRVRTFDLPPAPPLPRSQPQSGELHRL